jgi:hypothetical protein
MARGSLADRLPERLAYGSSDFEAGMKRLARHLPSTPPGAHGRPWASRRPHTLSCCDARKPTELMHALSG